MIVVSNTSPIFNLGAIGHLDLLPRLYPTILVPDAVWQELRTSPGSPGGGVGNLTPAWLERRPLSGKAVAAALSNELDPGEAEAVALALEVPADLLLVDERKARATAARLGLKCLGLLGVLLEAKRAGILPAVKSLLDALVIQAGFWVSPALYQRVLTEAGE